MSPDRLDLLSFYLIAAVVTAFGVIVAAIFFPMYRVTDSLAAREGGVQ